MVYLTFGDKYSGIYNSQVIDTLKFVQKSLDIKITLIAFVPYTIFFEQKRQIQNEFNKAKVFPMIPSRNHWWPLSALLAIPFILGQKTGIGRGVIATNMLLFFKKLSLIKSTNYDGRGAIWAEHSEYISVNHPERIKNAYKWEKKSVLKSDYRIAVSQQLVNYWRDTYNYKGDEHKIIPCTFSSIDQRASKKIEINEKNEITIVFSGGNDLWQSKDLMTNFFLNVLSANLNAHLILLTRGSIEDFSELKQYSNRIEIKWVKPHEVLSILTSADYGILIREASTTNKVAAPTKFAEYLIAGLKIIISPNIGDYTDLVLNNNLGIVADTESQLALKKQSIQEKHRIHNFASDHFSKQKYLDSYSKIFQ